MRGRVVPDRYACPAARCLLPRRALHPPRQHPETVDDGFLVFEPGHFELDFLQVAQDQADSVVVTFLRCVGEFVFQFAALARASAVVAGIAFCAEPVVAALSSAVMLGEQLSAVQLLGGVLVLAAIATNVMAEQRRVRSLEPQAATS